MCFMKTNSLMKRKRSTKLQTSLTTQKHNLHNYFFILNKKMLDVLKRFFIRYVISYFRTHKCMVCFETSWTLTRYCVCSFLMCASCFDKIIFQCPQCRSDHELMNHKKHLDLLLEQQQLYVLLRQIFHRTDLIRFKLNIYKIIQRIENTYKRCTKTVDTIKNLKQKRLREQQEQEHMFVFTEPNSEQFMYLLNTVFSQRRRDVHRVDIMPPPLQHTQPLRLPRPSHRPPSIRTQAVAFPLSDEGSERIFNMFFNTTTHTV